MSQNNRRDRARSARAEGRPSGGHRHQRLEHCVAQEIETLVDHEAADPAFEEVRWACPGCLSFLRFRLASQLSLNRVPRLTFTFVGLAEGLP
jgi:hypothetical protein